MVRCCLYCKKRECPEATNAGRSLHSFPLENPNLVEIWKRQLKLHPSFRPTQNTKVCSDHFHRSDFEFTSKRRRLCSGSIPTIFSERTISCFYCDATRVSKPGLSLRKFPIDKPKLLKKWLAAINIKNFVPNRDTLICSDHFTESSFRKVKNRTFLNLKDDAVPSIFLRGKCAKLRDYFSPDWVPSLYLGHLGKSAHLRDYRNPDWVPTLNLGNGKDVAKKRLERQKRREKIFKKDCESNVTETLSETNDEDDIRSENDSEEHSWEDYSGDENSDEFEAVTDKPAPPPDKGIHCCVPDCLNVRTKDSIIKFFRFPSVTKSSNGTIYRSERLSAWINAIKRIDITHLNAQYKVICFEHFKTGAPSNDKSHVDWVPNQKLPGTLTKAVQKAPTGPKKTDPIDPLAEDEIQMEVEPVVMEIVPNAEIEKMKKEIQRLKLENSSLNHHLVKKDFIIGEQNTKIQKLIETHKLELHEKDAKIQLLETTNLKIALSKDGFKNDDRKVNYFTGLPSFAVLEIIFNFVQEELHGSLLRRINKFDAFILVLLKLRLDLPLTYIGYRYGIAGNTAANIFHTNLKMLSEKIGPFIRWPDKTANRENTSLYFKRVLGNKFTALLDFIEDPGPNVSREYKVQKKYVKNKYLIAISPAGAITFVSKGYDSSLSLKEIAESCGVLDYTDDGDIILSDHGLVTHQVYSYNGSKVLVESTQEDNDLLDSLLENPNQLLNSNDTNEVDSSRIYIQRTISNLTNKFFILRNKQKVNIEKSYKSNDGDRYFDYVVKVCCALANVQPAILTLDTSKS